MKISIPIKEASTLSELRTREGRPTLYQPYFHKLSNGSFNLRLITPHTNLEWIREQARLGNIFIPDEIITAESH